MTRSLCEWQALRDVLYARESGFPTAVADARLIVACGSPEAALASLRDLQDQARRTGVPALDIALAGCDPAPTSTGPARHAAPVDAPRGTVSRPGVHSRQLPQPPAVERPARDGVLAAPSRVWTWALVAPALVVVVAAIGTLKGALWTR